MVEGFNEGVLTQDTREQAAVGETLHATALTTPLLFQIRKYPSFKRFFNEFSDASLRKLVATLDSRKARLSEEGRSLTNRPPPPCAFGTLNKFAANRSCTICTLMQSSGEYKGHSYAHFLSRKAQQVRKEGKSRPAGPTGQPLLTFLIPPTGLLNRPFKIASVPVGAHMCECHGARVEVRGQLTGVGSLLLPCRFWGWMEVSLPALVAKAFTD